MKEKHMHGAVQEFLMVHFGARSDLKNTIQLIHDVEEFFGGCGMGS